MVYYRTCERAVNHGSLARRVHPGREVDCLMAEVHVTEGEPLDVALRRFKRKVQQEDIIKDVKRHSYYMKPGEKRRLKQALARKRLRKRSRMRRR